jgi:hypothetical protein
VSDRHRPVLVASVFAKTVVIGNITTTVSTINPSSTSIHAPTRSVSTTTNPTPIPQSLNIQLLSITTTPTPKTIQRDCLVLIVLLPHIRPQKKGRVKKVRVWRRVRNDPISRYSFPEIVLLFRCTCVSPSLGMFHLFVSIVHCHSVFGIWSVSIFGPLGISPDIPRTSDTILPDTVGI